MSTETNPFASANAASRREDPETEGGGGSGEEEEEEAEGDGGGVTREEGNNIDEEGDPDLLLFHNRSKTASDDAGDGTAAPSPAPAPGAAAAEAAAAAAAAALAPAPSRGTPTGSTNSSAKSGRGGVEGRRTPILQDWRPEQVEEVPAPLPRGGGGGGTINRGGMEWITTQHLDLSPVRAGAPSVQPHCAAFHHTQALFAAAVGRNIIGKFDPVH